MTPPSELDEDMHLIIHLMTETRLPPTYVYAHVDEAGGPWVEAAAKYCWIVCRTTLGDRWAPYRGRADTDYSPSKLPSKVAPVLPLRRPPLLFDVIMRVVSWNVQGMGGPQFLRFRGRMRQELQSALVGGQIDMLMLQEHHLSESRTRRCGRLLPWTE